MSQCFFFFKQKTAYEVRISDWSSDVCSSDLRAAMTSFPMLAPRTWRPLGAAWTVALVSSLAVLFIGDVMGQAPCNLRSEEGRVGKECVSTCRSRWSPFHKNQNQAIA